MSMTILWEPVRQGFGLQDTGATSDTITRLENTFGSMPIKLTEDHCFALSAMSNASGCKAYANLADIIHEHGPISVWAES